MKTGDLAQQFGVSSETIRRWVSEFEDFFSAGARKKTGRQSLFDANDYVVMATIADLSLKQKYPLNVIHEQLASGYRVEDVEASTIGYSDGRMVPAAAVEQMLDATEVRLELEQVRAERDKLAEMLKENQQQLRELRDRLNEVENERRAETSLFEAQRREEITRLKDTIAELQHRLGMAEGELLYRRQLDEKRQDE